MLVEEHQNYFYRFSEECWVRLQSRFLEAYPLSRWDGDDVVLRFRTSVLGVDEAENTLKVREL